MVGIHEGRSLREISEDVGVSKITVQEHKWGYQKKLFKLLDKIVDELYKMDVEPYGSDPVGHAFGDLFFAISSTCPVHGEDGIWGENIDITYTPICRHCKSDAMEKQHRNWREKNPGASHYGAVQVKRGPRGFVG